MLILFIQLHKQRAAITSVTQKVVSVFAWSSAPDTLYMLVCIIQITAGEQQQQQQQQPPLPQSVSQSAGATQTGSSSRARFAGIKWFIIIFKCSTIKLLPAQLRPGRPGDESKHVPKSRRHTIIIIPPWKPVNDLMAGFDPHAQASRLIKQTNGN